MLESRVQWLEDVEAIRRLKALQATQIDDAVNGGGSFHPVLERFAPDAVWESEHFGRHDVARFLEDYRSRVSFCLHYVLGDIIDVARDRATARAQWISWEPTTLDGTAIIVAGRYFDDLDRAPEGWRFTRVRFEVGFIAPYGRSWARERIPHDWRWSQMSGPPRR